ncbi:HEAT repeat domain-containing protein [bacterium]|nr:HEAT repeat domain-containing protein [bacterium]
MHRILIIFFLCAVHSSSSASELIRYSQGPASLPERIQWAFRSASGEKQYWIGYSVTRFMYPNEIFMSGVSINGDFRQLKNKPSLQEWISGVKIVPKKDVREIAESELSKLENSKRAKVWKEIGIFHRYQSGAKFPDRTKVVSLTVWTSFDGPLVWLGTATHEESFLQLSGMYQQTRSAEVKEDMMAAIGVHPPPIAFPFFKKVLTSQEPEEAQEAAAIFVGELDTPEALQLLQQVIETNPSEEVRESAVVGIAEFRSEESLQILSDVARNHRDSELRETALAMLGDTGNAKATKILEEIAWFDSDSEIRETAVVMLGERDDGVPALLKIMEEHPSKDTREIAIHILAESVAGRDILKKKIKE